MRGGLGMGHLIVEENVGAEGGEHLLLADAAQEEGLVYADGQNPMK